MLYMELGSRVGHQHLPHERIAWRSLFLLRTNMLGGAYFGETVLGDTVNGYSVSGLQTVKV